MLSPTSQQTAYVKQSFGDLLRSVNTAPGTPRTPRHASSRSPAPPPCELPQPPDVPQLPVGASFDENLRAAAFDSAEYGSATCPDEAAEQEIDQLQRQQTPVLPGGSELDEPQPPQQQQEQQPATLELLPASASTAPLTTSVTGSAAAARGAENP